MSRRTPRAAWLRRLGGRIPGLLPLPRVDAGTRFEPYAGALGLRYVQLVALVMAASALLWWPTDPWVFRDTPAAIEVFARTRPLIALISLGVFVVAHALRDHPWSAELLVVAGGFPQAFLLGWHYAELGGLDRAWFYFAYFFPLASLAALTPLAARFGVAAAVSTAYPLAYFLRFPRYAEDERFGISISFLAFVVLTTTVIGHVIYRLLRRNFDEQVQLERRVEERTDALRRLARYVDESREVERKRVARDLHDEMGQLLSAMRIELGIARGAGTPVEYADALTRVSQLIDDAFEAYHGIIESLRPRVLDERGLVPAIDALAERVGAQSSLDVRLEVSGDDDVVPDGAAVVVYRLVQEALTNVVRHAGPSEVSVALHIAPEWVDVSVRDGGVGFDVDAGVGRGFGLLGMRERVRNAGGELQIASAPGQGARVSARVPRTGDGDLPGGSVD